MALQKTGLSKKQAVIALIMNLAMAFAGIFGAVNNFYYSDTRWGMMIYYTCNSNILGAAAGIMLAVFYVRMLVNGKSVPGWAIIVKYLSVCCLTITFLVTAFILTPMMAIDASLYGMSGSLTFLESAKFMLLGNITLWHHLLNPLFAFFSFLLFERLPTPPAKSLAFALIPTGLYAVISVTLNVLRIWHGPYPFLYVYEQPLWMSIIWFAIVVGGAAGISYLIARMKKPVEYL